MVEILWTDFKVPSDLEGSYELLVRPFRKTLNRGDDLWIEVYVSGYGNLAGGKIVFSFPQLFLKPQSFPIDFEKTRAEGSLESGLTLATNTQTGEETAIPAGQELPLQVGSSSSPLNLGGTIFGFHRGLGLANRGMESGGHIPTVAGETNMKLRPPLLIRGKVYERAPPGDHDVPFVLTYVTKGKVKTTHLTLQLHIRHWWERRLFQVIILAASLATVAGIVLALLHP